MQISRGRGSRLTIAVVTAAAVGCCAFVPSAGASAPPKHSYKLVVSRHAIVAGTKGKFVVALTNTSAAGTPLSSARVSAPAGFRLLAVSLPRGAHGLVRIKHNRIVLRNISVAPGSTLHVRVTATAPLVCGATPGNWHGTVWEGQLGGRQLHLKPKKSRTMETVSCPFSLRFTTQPTDAATGRPISGSSDNPGGPPVTVEVFNGSGTLVRVSTLVNITLRTNPSGSTLGGTTTARTVNGVATFKNLTLNKAGDGYSLTASSAGLTGTTSNRFNEGNAAVVCQQGQGCTTSLSTSVSTLSVTANPPPSPASDQADQPDTLSESVDVGTPLQCSGYTKRDPNWFEWVASSTARSKTITDTIKNTTIRGIQACFGAPFEFTTSSGQPAPQGTLPDGTPGFIGLLPSCNQFPGAAQPCVVSTMDQSDPSSSTGFDAVITATTPAGEQGDPYGMG